MDVLKMPPRIGTAQDRDTDYTQKIIEYDEQVISPAFEEWIRSQPMNTGISGYIIIGDSPGNDDFTQGKYTISSDTLKALGSDKESIMRVLGKKYSEAGYTTRVWQNELYFTKE